MAAPTKRRYINISTFKVGTAEYNTIQSVSENTDIQEIAASGDADTADSFLAKGKSSTRGEVVIQDPIQAQAMLVGAPGDITFSGQPEAGGVAVNVTLKNAIFFGKRATMLHNGVWGETLNFRCYDPTGANPVTIALAS